MALDPGAMAIIAVFSQDNTHGDGTGEGLIRLIATEDIAAGEQIRIYESGSTNADYLLYTVGSNGLNALDIITIIEDDNVITLDGDTTGTVQAFDGPTDTEFLPGQADQVSISARLDTALVSNGEVIWGVDGDELFGVDHSSTAAAEAHNTGGADPAVIIEDIDGNGTNVTPGDTRLENWVFTGSTIADLDDPSQYIWSEGDLDYSNPGPFATAFNNQVNITCFASGTLIATPDGAQSVETLQIGDLVITADGQHVPIRWLGKQRVNTLFHPNDDMGLVRIAAGALGNGLPLRDLTVTRDHGVAVDGLLINAGVLVNGTTIRTLNRKETGLSYVVWHVEIASHDLLLAEGAATESFVDYTDRSSFDNYDEYAARYGADTVITEMTLPRISSARMLPIHLRRRFGIALAA